MKRRLKQLISNHSGLLRRRDAGLRVFGLGAAKTGTHSLGTMFADRVASAHECDAERLIQLHLDRVDGHKDADTQLMRFLRYRDATRKLKIDSSQVNIYLVQDIEGVFPGSLYIQTIRPPLAWLRSMLDDSLRRETSPTWMRFRDYRFQSGLSFPTAEKPLEDRGLFTLEGYLGYWRDSIANVIDHVPEERLMTVLTSDLAKRSAEIAAFAGISGGAAAQERTHAFRNDTRFGLLQGIPPDHLGEVAERICGPVLRRVLPDHDLAAEVTAIREMDAA